MTVPDIIILIPVLPVLLVLVICWVTPGLVLEEWLCEKVPKIVSGPYILYLSFAAWHFHFSRWIVISLSVIGGALLAVSFLKKARN